MYSSIYFVVWERLRQDNWHVLTVSVIYNEIDSKAHFTILITSTFEIDKRSTVPTPVEKPIIGQAFWGIAMNSDAKKMQPESM